MYATVTVSHTGLTNLFDPLLNSGLHGAAGLVIDSRSFEA
ncbi:hypothetical protein OHAE_654 [Ochrobactrum soli]|uniref:Uncharacterized protein n=1 Tax=Ochrobactrum soli TaxID=2448455 RepID=A0A2P9HKZ0_9HYPH|nr:hypothetical protein OHAE_654 [[Ochrobactrum] soli]